MFATAIHADVPFADLRDHLCRDLAPWNLGLDPTGLVTDARDSFAYYEILAPEAYADRPWHHAAHPCPFVGPLAGYLRWESWEDAEALIDSDLPLALMREGRGVTARLADDPAVEAVALRRFDLVCAVDKFGFDDGGELLTRAEGAYEAHVLDAIHTSIRAAGLAAHLSWMCTCHNPVRLSGVQHAEGARLVDALWDVRGAEPRLVAPDEALVGLSAEVWAYDFTVLRDHRFWERG